MKRFASGVLALFALFTLDACLVGADGPSPTDAEQQDSTALRYDPRILGSWVEYKQGIVGQFLVTRKAGLRITEDSVYLDAAVDTACHDFRVEGGDSTMLCPFFFRGDGSLLDLTFLGTEGDSILLAGFERLPIRFVGSDSLELTVEKLVWKLARVRE